MKKHTATITFHASHNYGSMLQAYALQKTIELLGHKNEIINFRTAKQKDCYTIFTKRKGIKYVFKNLSHLLYYTSLKKSYNNFETFLNNHLKLSANEYATEEDLKNANFDYDTIIAGSDQIWNPVPKDFDWAYYLTFASQSKKVAYAPSFGQLASLGDNETQAKIASSLKKIDVISVREQGAADNVKKLIGKDPQIVVDPTLLVDKKDWLKLVENEPRLIKGDYIFFYTLFADPERLAIVKKISKILGMPIVTSNFSNQYDVFSTFKKRFDAGPLEFLTLIRDAKFVVVSSFHGTVFSSILNKPFLAINGMTDARISTLLNTLHLEYRAVTIDDVEEKCRHAYDIDFAEVNRLIVEARKPSIQFLKDNI